MTRVYRPQCRALLSIVFDGFGESALDSPRQLLPCTPRTVTIHRNAYRDADTFDMTFAYGDLPIDPQLVRGCQVEIYLFDAAEQNEVPRLLNREAGNLSTASELTASGLDGFAEFRRQFVGPTAKPAFIGLVTNHPVDRSGDDATVTLTGEDYTYLLKQRQWPPLDGGRSRPIPVGKRLDLILEDVLAMADETGKLALRVDGIERSALPVVDRAGVGGKHGIPVASETKFFDVMSQLAGRHGMIVFVDGLDVVLSTSHNLHGMADPNIRMLTWGRDIASMRMERAMGIEAAPGVVVRYRDANTGKIAEAEWPTGIVAKAKASKAKNVEKSLSPTHRHKAEKRQSVTISTDYQIVPLMEVGNAADALRAAQAYYTRLGSHERTATITTDDLADTNGRSLLDLRAGDAMRVIVDTFTRAVMDDVRLSDGERVDRFVEHGFTRSIAELIVRHYEKLLTMQRPLKVREATLDFDIDAGVTIEAQMVDFIVLNGIRENRPSREQSADAALRAVDGGAIGRLVGL